MEIQLELDYRDKETSKLIDTVRISLSESDLDEVINHKFQNGDYPCAIHLDREHIKVWTEIKSVNI